MDTETQIALPLDSQAPEHVPEPRPWPQDKCTPALHRVLSKAREKGCVRRAGIYADVPQSKAADHPEFDRQTAIDRCIAAGWLAAGVAFNTYVPTPAGRARVDAPADQAEEGGSDA
jgi:hypothetical protein